MPDARNHRGPHPEDNRLFGDGQLSTLQFATRDLCWLLSRGYGNPSALKLVGDRYHLAKRQRTAVYRSACSEEQRALRAVHALTAIQLAGQPLWIDGYNALTSIEAALSGGVLLRGQDGCLRDMASMHGSYRKVAETIPAIQLIGDTLETLGVSEVRWLLDQPVSNSGRLRSILRQTAEEHGWNWTVDLVPDPDPLLKITDNVVATADSVILDAADRWFDLVSLIVMEKIADARVVDLSNMTEGQLPTG